MEEARQYPVMSDRAFLVLQAFGFLAFAAVMWRIARPASEFLGRVVRGIHSVTSTVLGASAGRDSSSNEQPTPTWFFRLFETIGWLWFKGGAVILVWVALVSLLAGIAGWEG